MKNNAKQNTMEEKNKHWKNLVKVFSGVPIQNVEKTLNEFYEGRFVIATQSFPYEIDVIRVFDLIVYYKVAPSK